MAGRSNYRHTGRSWVMNDCNIGKSLEERLRSVENEQSEIEQKVDRNYCVDKVLVVLAIVGITINIIMKA